MSNFILIVVYVVWKQTVKWPLFVCSPWLTSLCVVNGVASFFFVSYLHTKREAPYRDSLNLDLVRCHRLE